MLMLPARNDPSYARLWWQQNPEKNKADARARWAKDPEKYRTYYREWYAKNRDGSKTRKLRSKYKITPAFYAELFEQQDGVCAICSLPEIRRHHLSGNRFSLAVDHDHETGEVRGLLCRPCNVAIGNMFDDPDRLRNAIQYLKKHR